MLLLSDHDDYDDKNNNDYKPEIAQLYIAREGF